MSQLSNHIVDTCVLRGLGNGHEQVGHVNATFGHASTTLGWIRRYWTWARSAMELPYPGRQVQVHADVTLGISLPTCPARPNVTVTGPWSLMTTVGISCPWPCPIVSQGAKDPSYDNCRCLLSMTKTPVTTIVGVDVHDQDPSYDNCRCWCPWPRPQLRQL